MSRLNFIVLIITIMLFTSPLYSQVIYSGSIREQIERWEGKNSKNIIDYVLKLRLQSFKEETQVIRGKGRSLSNNYYVVIRTEINGWDPVEYQITLREDYYTLRGSPSRKENILMLIFEHPEEKSIRKQFEELKKNKPDISLEEAASEIKIKQDIVFIDSTFKYFNLINEMFSLELPVEFDRSYILEGTWSQVYMHNINNEHYSLFQFDAGEHKFINWIERLFMAMIDQFNAIYPYPKKENK